MTREVGTARRLASTSLQSWTDMSCLIAQLSAATVFAAVSGSLWLCLCRVRVRVMGRVRGRLRVRVRVRVGGEEEG